MSKKYNRINTIIAIIASSPAYSGSNVNKIKRELHQIENVNIVSPSQRKNLLKILHATRSLDTCLKNFVSFHRISSSSYSIGKHLSHLSRHSSTAIGRISLSEKAHYQRSIVDIRNLHMHQADSYPSSDRDVNTIISEIQSLMSRVSSL